jgi:hypothetical protein
MPVDERMRARHGKTGRDGNKVTTTYVIYTERRLRIVASAVHGEFAIERKGGA